MEPLIRKIKPILESEFAGATVQLEPASPEGRVTGLLVWSGFEGIKQIRRQGRLWKVLKKKLSPQEQLQVTGILTVTPEEMAVSD